MYKFERLRVWQAAMFLAESIYRFQEKCPSIEKFGLLAQLRRAVTSVSLNVAEGQSSNSDKEFIRYLRISRGSLYETVTILYLLKKLYQVKVDDELARCHQVGNLLSSLIKSLLGPKTNDQRPRTLT